MLKPSDMTKIRVICPKSVLRDVIDTMHDLKAVHIVDYKGGNFFDLGKPFEENAGYSADLVKVRALISQLNVKGNGKKLSNVDDARGRIKSLECEFVLLTDKILSLKGKQKSFIEEKEKGFGEKLTSAEEALIKADRLGKALPKEAVFSGHIEADIKTAELELKRFREKNSQLLLDFEFSLKQLSEKAEAPMRFAASQNAAIINGWVPTRKLDDLKSKLAKSTEGKFHFESFETDDEAPVELNNPSVIGPFEFFLNLYSLPKHNELDPTILVFLTFPLFFGFMLGDIGYGLVSLLAFFGLRYALRKQESELKLLSNILIVASLATIFFGFVFGEFFGAEIFEHPILNRAHDINLMILVSVIVGAIHVNLGLLVGFYNELSKHGLMKAVFAKFSWIIFEAGVALVAADMILKVLPGASPIGGVMILAALAMLYKAEGALGIIEIPAIFSNMLSYARLFAVGIASVLLAVVINDMAGALMKQGGFFMVAGIGVLIVGHLINLLLGIIGPFLQSMRLHYVEFFPKFYEGGGERYNPFGRAK